MHQKIIDALSFIGVIIFLAFISSFILGFFINIPLDQELHFNFTAIILLIIIALNKILKNYSQK